MIAWFLVLFFIVKTYLIEGYEVQGDSMLPTLESGEHILVSKLSQSLSQLRLLRGVDPLDEGDVVVFYSPVEPKRRYVKRVVAKGPPGALGKTVAAQRNRSASEPTVKVTYDRGELYVNNRRVDEPYLARPPVYDGATDETRLTPGRYYVMGDNRAVSRDSRAFGPIDEGQVVGKALLCFWPPSRIRLIR